MRNTSALFQDGEADYTLNPEYASCWITVDNFSVYIFRRPCGELFVDIYKRGEESEDPIASTYASE